MATYGARYIQWAPFAAADADNDSSKYPSYGAPMNLGALQKVTDAPTNNEAKTYGDDVLDAYVSEFKEYTLDVEVTEMLNEVASAVTGAKIVEAGNDLEFGAEDVAPYGGLAFFVSKMLKSGGRKYLLPQNEGLCDRRGIHHQGREHYACGRKAPLCGHHVRQRQMEGQIRPDGQPGRGKSLGG